MRMQEYLCGKRIGQDICKLPPSAHGIELNRPDVKVSHPFVIGERSKAHE